jgi:DNA-directed RNA polymerase subunit RPC12/RpoP
MSKRDKFIYCPWCGSQELTETDYEDSSGEIEEDGIACEHCNWQGHVDELICKPSQVSAGNVDKPS